MRLERFGRHRWIAADLHDRGQSRNGSVQLIQLQSPIDQRWRSDSTRDRRPYRLLCRRVPPRTHRRLPMPPGVLQPFDLRSECQRHPIGCQADLVLPEGAEHRVLRNIRDQAERFGAGHSVLDALRHQSPRDLVAAPSRSGVLKRHLKHASIVTDSAFIPLHIFDTHRRFEYAGARQRARPLNRGREFPGLAQARKILLGWEVPTRSVPGPSTTSSRPQALSLQRELRRGFERVATLPAPTRRWRQSSRLVPGCSEP